ncbi:autotransporter family protein [Microbulbifer celer]|uniref:Autotransporter outer membrane beta-barrel domain-containing protein n=1 Tax=Microbulbifer celer TaxID=435905 RepID=A0ABW3U9X0_9GAMM|nr:autotransporter outer membrane beta-barrel domain-containing protein [Microbulbifer celer]UFN57374.1 autotransporter outer membrane beta-barrel domain-containing protein [Microbulbifer celer]
MSYRRAGSALFACAPAQLPTILAPFVAVPALIGSLMPMGASADIILDAGNNQLTLDSDSRIAGSSVTLIDGGTGRDRLHLNGVTLNNPARLKRWEHIVLRSGSQLELDSDLTLGDSDSLDSSLEIDRSSTLLLPYFSTGIRPGSGQPVRIINSGTIDMRGTSANQLLIDGSYRGSGRIYMDMVAGDDDSPADRVIIDGGHASGTTELVFQRLAGSGTETNDGIMVVETRNGGTTSTGAFYMPRGISAGPYEYYLFRGTGDPQDEDNWYLRSTVQPGETPATSPQPDVDVLAFGGHTDGGRLAAHSDTEVIDTGHPEDSVIALPTAGSEPIRLYRPEIPLYAQAKSLARVTSLQEIGSYHKRRGEQRSWFDGINQDWIRIHHMTADYNWSGDIDNRFDGDITGFQVGTNLWSGPTCTGGARESGIFLGSTRASGDVTGFARGFSNYASGSNKLTSTHIGYYFNDYRPDMSYFDITLKVAYLELESRSSRGVDTTIYGPQLTASIEKGLTYQATESFNLEPQLQAVVNYSNLGALNDGISWVESDKTPEANFRAGLRAYNNDGEIAGQHLRFYGYGNLWHTLGGNDQLLFNANLQLDMERRSTWAEFGGGVVLLEHKLGSAFFNIGFQRSLDDLDWSGGSASLGFNWAW